MYITLLHLLPEHVHVNFPLCMAERRTVGQGVGVGGWKNTYNFAHSEPQL